jgi:hypothetical protein
VVWGFIGLPFHNTDFDGLTTPFATGVGGTFTGEWDLLEGVGGLAAQLSHILNGRAYINFHTLQFPGGEVRGNLQVAPEPTNSRCWASAAQPWPGEPGASGRDSK